MVEVPEWMSHLKTDRRGLPIPYINRYGAGDDVKRFRIQTDPNADGELAVWNDDDPNAAVDFTRQHMGRQRRCMFQGRCQVCARLLTWDERVLVIATETVETITLPALGGEVAVITEPWLCKRCATFAIAFCPALIRRRRDEQLTVLPIGSRDEVQMVASRGYVDGPLMKVSKRLQPIMWLKLYTPMINVRTAAARG